MHSLGRVNAMSRLLPQLSENLYLIEISATADEPDARSWSFRIDGNKPTKYNGSKLDTHFTLTADH